MFQGKRQSHLPINNLDGETQWKYRGRTSAERNSNEPLAAPTGLDAQQKEGFRRFYNAVSSPTHVRVTAGGRIVPNTRSTTSPTTKWDKEQAVPPSGSVDVSQTTPKNTVDQNGKVQQLAAADLPMMLPPMAHPMYPGFAPMFPPTGAPMPFFPIPNGMPMHYGLPQPHSVMAHMAQNPVTQKEEQPSSSSVNTQTESGQEDNKNSKPASIKVSDPNNFDQSRPYFFNGNVYYPGGAPLPVQAHPNSMTPNPYFGGFPVHPAVARVGSFGHPHPMFPVPGVHGLMPPGFVPIPGGVAPNSPQFPQPALKPDAAPITSDVKPPVTSIKPSQITQSQLASLRSQLKYYEDQIQYNKHQIDETATQDQIQTIRKLIEQFENNYQMQKNFENALRPSGEKRVVTIGAEATHCKTPCTPGTKENNLGVSAPAGSAKPIQRNFSTLSHTQSMDQIRPRPFKESRHRAGINCSKGMDTTSALGDLEAHLMKTRLYDPVKKSSLPTRAALAPIFEPREPTLFLPSHEPSDLNSMTDLNASFSSESQWDYSKTLPLNRQELRVDMSSAGQFLPSGAPENGIGGSTVPYLVGQLPQGVTTASANPHDYSYIRELSEEEKRARHVYWGGVSTKGSGLPKFDGKDFYPASPVKPDNKTDSATRRVSTGRPDIDYSFGKMKKSEDPFRVSHDSESIRSAKSTRKLSHAVPIINPETMAREDVKISPKAAERDSSQAVSSMEGQRQPLRENAQPSPTKTPTGSISEKSASTARRGLERTR